MPAGVVLTLMLAQSLPAEAVDTAKMERIRRQLAEPPAIDVSSALGREGLVFRMTVFGRKTERPVWADLSGVPPYVRPPFPSYHFEFLEQVTPEQFRAGTLYPMGIPVITAIQLLTKEIKAVNRQKQETRAREEVKKALEEFLACRVDPLRPGC
jgi:hypothetical protein